MDQPGTETITTPSMSDILIAVETQLECWHWHYSRVPFCLYKHFNKYEFMYKDICYSGNLNNEHMLFTTFYISEF